MICEYDSPCARSRITSRRASGASFRPATTTSSGHPDDHPGPGRCNDH
jgi:hypothetical protein